MGVVANSRNKKLYKFLVALLKCIPVLLALCAALNTFFDFFGIDSGILSLIGGMSLLPLLFLYLASYVFCFCEYHRMFLHYIVVNNILTYVDYFIGIPISNKALFSIHICVVFLFLVLILYLHQRDVVYHKRIA